MREFASLGNGLAARVYAKGAQLGEGMARTAEEIKLKAQRKAGECLIKLDKGKGGGSRHQVQKLLLARRREPVTVRYLPRPQSPRGGRPDCPHG
jgi:hypothetical protein